MTNQAETKSEKFKRLAAKRTTEAMYRIKVLSNCSNRGIYEYDQKEVDKIFSEIERSVREAKSMFKSKHTKSDFHL